MLPQKLDYPKMLTTWAQQLDPVIANSILQGTQLSSISLVAGSNTVNHLLGKKLTGWFITRIRASATIYDTQDSNQLQSLTLTLTASAPCVVDIWVY